MSRTYAQVIEGQWLNWQKKERWACCDCGLIHIVERRAHKGKFQIRMFRDNRATAQIRRHAKVITVLDKSPVHEKLKK